MGLPAASNVTAIPTRWPGSRNGCNSAATRKGWEGMLRAPRVTLRRVAQLLECAEGVPAVPCDENLRGEDVADDALRIDHVGGTPGEQTERLLHAVQLADRIPAVAQKRERQPLARGKAPVRRDGIRTDADDSSAHLGETIVAPLKGACLERTPRGSVLRIEVQHERLFADQVS